MAVHQVLAAAGISGTGAALTAARSLRTPPRPGPRDPWGAPVNLGPPVNVWGPEWGPSLSTDGLTPFFNSTRCGSADDDLWVTTRPTLSAPWGTPVNLGPQINSATRDRRPDISADGLTLLFDSPRAGGLGMRDLWQITVTPDCAGNPNGTCESGENCQNCPADCFRGPSAGCGDGVCEPSLDEDCLSCPSDCNGKQKGRPADHFCCGCAGENPVGCDDPRCTTEGFDCSDQPVPSSCCGDGLCEGIEDGFNCGVDCAAPCTVPADCDDADPCTIDDCVGTVCVNSPIDCDDGDACTADGCSGGTCFNDPIDCDDGDACSADTCDPGSGCENTFPDCGPADGCCGPACDPGNDPDCPCAGKIEPCSVNEDCCSLNCLPSGKCTG